MRERKPEVSTSTAVEKQIVYQYGEEEEAQGKGPSTERVHVGERHEFSA